MPQFGRRRHSLVAAPHGRVALAVLLIGWATAAVADPPSLPIIRDSSTSIVQELPALAPATAVRAPSLVLRVPVPPPQKPPILVEYTRPAIVADRGSKVVRSGAELPPPLTQLPDPKLNPKAVPMTLDTVLRLVSDQNGQVRLARERLQEAYVEQVLADKRWLPEISVGAGFWRHEGGIQDFQGNLIKSSYGSALAGLELRGTFDVRDAIYQRLDAQRKIWQQQGELTKFSTDQLLDAASTYVDLLMARAAEAIARDAESKLRALLIQAQKLEKIDPGVRIESARVASELGAQQILTRRFLEGARSASAKLVYLLGLDPDSELVVLEKQLIAFNLVDANQSTDLLLDVALRQGPGVHEMQAILSILEEMRAKNESPLHWLPTLEVRMAEGAFGASPGSSQLDWANRWDLGVQARWNLTEMLTSRPRKQQGNLKIQQAYLGYHDLRAKLVLGVQEAREVVRSNQEQFSMATRQIQHAEETYQLADLRLRENIKGRSPSEVLLAVRSLVGARLGYLQMLRDHDKAQLRLFVLTGGPATAAGQPR